LTYGADDREPSVSRDGSTIAFVRGGDIFSMSSDGSDLHELTAGPDLDEFPQISPNGRFVLFVRRSVREGPGDLYAVSLEGGEPRALAISPRDDEEPSFSPDGKAIVFVRSLPAANARGTNEELFSIRPNGTGLARLTRTPQDERHPHYFPRGIIFDRGEPGHGAPRTIYAMRRNGRNVRSIVNERSGAEVKAVSPDGRLLVFEVLGRGTWRKRLVGPTRRSLRPHRLTTLTSDYLVFSPDGRRVAGAFTNNSSEVAPFSVLFSLDVVTGRSHYEGETWESEAPGPVQTSIGPRLGW
jgi:Tol biopolymer transport system component